METEKSICHAICKNISYLVRIYPGYSYFHVNIGMQVSIYTGISPIALMVRNFHLVGK